MRKKLKKVGNSWVLVLGKEIMGFLKVNPVLDELELEIEKDILHIKKFKEENKKGHNK